MNKKILIVFLVIIIFVFFLQKIGFFEIMVFFPPSKHDIEKLYYKNEAELMSICNFLWESQYSGIRIELLDSDNTAICYQKSDKGGYDEKVFEVDDVTLMNSLETIKNSGFIRVLKEYNYISFQVWGSFGGSVNLMFSSSEEPNISEIHAREKKVEKIRPIGWYYCRIIE